jgi:hypothetical protein
VPKEGVIKIVPEAGAKQDAVPFLSQTPPGLEDQVVTEVTAIVAYAATMDFELFLIIICSYHTYMNLHSTIVKLSLLLTRI